MMHTYVLITEYSITWKEPAGKLYFGGVNAIPAGGKIDLLYHNF